MPAACTHGTGIVGFAQLRSQGGPNVSAAANERATVCEILVLNFRGIF